jgi:hypothetical protein
LRARPTEEARGKRRRNQERGPQAGGKHDGPGADAGTVELLFA